MTDDIGARQIGGLLVAIGMVLTGYLGLIGTISPSPLLIAVIFIVAILLAYSMGKNRGEAQDA